MSKYTYVPIYTESIKNIYLNKPSIDKKYPPKVHIIRKLANLMLGK